MSNVPKVYLRCDLTPIRELLHSELGPFIMVVNHQHSIDILFLFEIWPEIERATTLAKRALLYFGPFGLSAYLNGTTFIDRSRGAESRKILEDTIIKASLARALARNLALI